MGMIPEGVYCFDDGCYLIDDINDIKDTCYQMYITKQTREIEDFVNYHIMCESLPQDYIGFWFKTNEDDWYNVTKIKNTCLEAIN